ncbi:MAG: helix-turn-helix domain-containing protein [Erysipelotrichaceae bacterium]|nr:helix-turn-helix domain-containing protein [Erysipelotrichaceae bacterium]
MHLKELSLYFKLLRILNNLTIEEVAQKIYISKSQYHRLEMDEYEFEDDYIKSLCLLYNIKELQPFDETIIQNIDKTISYFFDNMSKYQEVVIPKGLEDITQLEHINLPYRIYHRYIQKFVLYERDDEFFELSKILFKLIDGFPLDYQSLFYALYGFALKQQNNILEAEQYLKKASNIGHSSDLVKGLFSNYLLAVYGNQEKFDEAMQMYEEAKMIFTKHQCKHRLVNINMLLANLYSKMNLSYRSIELDQETLKIISKNNVENIHNIYHNIGYEYSRLNEHEKAIFNYEKAIEIKIVVDTYFDLAWSYYKVNNFKAVERCLESVKKEQFKIPYYYEFSKWLLEMIKSPHTLKCLRILKRIERKYGDTMAKDDLIFLYVQLFECYKQRKDLELALEYATKLIEEKVIVR